MHSPSSTCDTTSTFIIITIIIAIIAIIAIIIEAMDRMLAKKRLLATPRPKPRKGPWSFEAQLWGLLQTVPSPERKELLQHLSESQRRALERWALQAKAAAPAELGAVPAECPAEGERARRARRRVKAAASMEPRAAVARCLSEGKTACKSKAGIPFVCSHRGRGSLRFDARVSCWPFLLITKRSAHLPTVLSQREILLAVQHRFLQSQDAEASWQAGIGTHEMQKLKWQRFVSAVSAEFEARQMSLTSDCGIRFEASVPANFLLGKRLQTPHFAVSEAGLQKGYEAWQSLYSVHSRSLAEGVRGRTNRFSAVAYSAEGLQEAWQKVRKSYAQLWQAAGYSAKRLEAKLALLEQRFLKVHSKKRTQKISQLDGPAVDQKVSRFCRLLRQWTLAKGGRCTSQRCKEATKGRLLRTCTDKSLPAS